MNDSSAHLKLLGPYNDWAENLLHDPPLLSFRNSRTTPLPVWKQTARDAIINAIALTNEQFVVEAETIRVTEHEGVRIEELRWRLPYGPPTQAVVLRPKTAVDKLPGFLALHDHADNKYFGWAKIARAAGSPHPLIHEHHAQYYGGRPWANELAKRGYTVLAHDVFPFGSRRIRYRDVPEILRPHGQAREPEHIPDIVEYNQWAEGQEDVIAKSLLSAGTTWPAVSLLEDRAALDYLSTRDDVDADHIGCGGLSGGGIRTVYLAGLDDRIGAAICAGFMTTWKDFVRSKSCLHTWMAFAPGLPRYLEFPEILGARVPLPTLTVNSTGDDLFTFTETQRAVEMIEAVFKKAGAAERFMAHLHPGPHRLDRKMQDDAFDWLDRWLK